MWRGGGGGGVDTFWKHTVKDMINKDNLSWRLDNFSQLASLHHLKYMELSEENWHVDAGAERVKDSPVCTTKGKIA